MSALYQYTQLDAFEKALLGRCGTECRRGLEDNFDRYPLENHLSWLLNYKVNDMGSQLLLHPDLFGNHLLPEPEILTDPRFLLLARDGDLGVAAASRTGAVTYPCHALPYAVCDTCSFVATYRDVPLWEPESIAPITAASRTTFGPFTHVGDIDLATRVLSKKADVIKSARSAGYAALGLGHKSGDLDYTLRDHGDETADAIEMAVFVERGTPCAHGLRKNLCATPLHYQLDYLANYLVDEHLGLHGVVHAMTTPLPYPYWVTGSTGAALLKVATGDGWFLAFTTTSRKNPLIYPDDSPGFTCSHEWFVTVCTEGVVNRVLLGTAPISARPLTFEEVRDRALIPWRAVNTSGIKDTALISTLPEPSFTMTRRVPASTGSTGHTMHVLALASRTDTAHPSVTIDPPNLRTLVSTRLTLKYLRHSASWSTSRPSPLNRSLRMFFSTLMKNMLEMGMCDIVKPALVGSRLKLLKFHTGLRAELVIGGHPVSARSPCWSARPGAWSTTSATTSSRQKWAN